jgi:hypothetical protein
MLKKVGNPMGKREREREREKHNEKNQMKGLGLKSIITGRPQWRL